MNAAGLTFMALSWAVIIALNVYCILHLRKSR